MRRRLKAFEMWCLRQRTKYMDGIKALDAIVLEKFCGWLRGEKIRVSLWPTSTKTRHFGKVK